MATTPPRASSRREHWDAIYGRTTPTRLSWYEREPTVALELIDTLAVPHDAAIIDVGGGASTLVDHLFIRGFRDVTVLDVSDAALALARDRLRNAAAVNLVLADVVSWRPPRSYALWHDRAVFHFLVDVAERQRYLETLRSAVLPGGHAILATFAADGPERCSGLPVAGYGADDLRTLLGDGFAIVEVRREEHLTPDGITQPFTWVAARASA